MTSLLDIDIKRIESEGRPSHHVVPAEQSATWSSYLASWTPGSGDNKSAKSSKRSVSRSSTLSNLSRRSTRKPKNGHETLLGFRNPWPSWHKPTATELWKALEWGEDTDPCIKLAASRTNDQLPKSTQSSNTGMSDKVDLSNLDDETKATKKLANELLRVVKPDFTFDAQHDRAKTTWLGHAGVLLQFPPLKKGDRPVRCLFDPIFSMRCSPSQSAGPIRSYLPPCKLEDLPPIDVVMISHNHYDHLDYDSIMTIWKLHKACVRFVVPLANRQWFVDCGVDEDRVVELDWWEAAWISPLGSQDGSDKLKVTCTPSQHNSSRSGIDADATLWSSWYLEHETTSAKPYRVYFGGDSGYQFHASPGWPPPPPSSKAQRQQIASQVDDDSPQAKHPVCPVFREITSRLGSPHLLLLPVAVGATYDYFRSFVPLPDSLSPIPRHSPGVTAHNHMPPWDAVRVLNVMTADKTSGEGPPIAIAMHWGTFVIDYIEVLKTLGQLEWACEAHGVEFGRSLPTGDRRGKACFLAFNHGQSIAT